LVVPTSTSFAPAAAHDVGHAEGAADLDQLAARDDDLAAAPVHRCERGDGQQHGGGVVVDDRRRLGAGERAQQFLDEAVAVAAAARREVVLEVVGRGHRRQQVLECRIGKQRAPEVGVDHRAGEVEHAAHARGQPRVDARRQRVGQRIVAHLGERQRPGHGAHAQRIEQGARLACNDRVAVLGDERLHARRAQQAVDRR